MTAQPGLGNTSFRSVCFLQIVKYLHMKRNMSRIDFRIAQCKEEVGQSKDEASLGAS